MWDIQLLSQAILGFTWLPKKELEQLVLNILKAFDNYRDYFIL